MADVVIRAERLGKKYMIGHAAERERYVALRDVMARSARSLWRKTTDMARGRAIVAGDTVEEFWALKDVSFEVRRGEVLGIIGRNGAGKSTLLKILSRITEPSEGRVTIRGRVASLLEVGTGFHPELTGRENIYLNGAILGMTRAEIRKKFDEIVAFAEIEKFLDTPVKRYSSGMYVRLAFAVAAHLEPEILIIDEVLAVGDAQFQEKCLGKMSEVVGGGRTVLFVSHNMGAVRSLCIRGLLLDRGKVQIDGSVSKAIASNASQLNFTNKFSRPVHECAKPTIGSVRVLEPSRSRSGSTYVLIELSVVTSQQTRTSIDIRLKDAYSVPVGFGSVGAFKAICPVHLVAGRNHITLKMSVCQLACGEYSVSVDLTYPFVEFFDRVEDCVRFKIEADFRGASVRTLEQDWGYGSIKLPLQIMQPRGAVLNVPNANPDRKTMLTQ
jgi:lipopolysaccharide transport system ATP-binding protein